MTKSLNHIRNLSVWRYRYSYKWTSYYSSYFSVQILSARLNLLIESETIYMLVLSSLPLHWGSMKHPCQILKVFYFDVYTPKFSESWETGRKVDHYPRFVSEPRPYGDTKCIDRPIPSSLPCVQRLRSRILDRRRIRTGDLVIKTPFFDWRDSDNTILLSGPFGTPVQDLLLYVDLSLSFISNVYNSLLESNLHSRGRSRLRRT